MTEKLYYKDSHMHSFTAAVLSCTPTADAFAVTLDRTAFFPEGGGQPADTGTLDTVRVTDVQERAGEILHFTAAPLPVGKTVSGVLDWELRFRRMQGHSGEHIVSGIAHRLFDCSNVGFHMGTDDITIDFDRELTQSQLEEIERLANIAVYENRPVTAEFPSPAALQSMNYRSKLALTEDVRIVTIADYDVCACCAPHVSHTGEIGIIKLLDTARHRGGVRIRMLCGCDALADYRQKSGNIAEISAALSAKQAETAAAVNRILGELAEAKQALLQLKTALVTQKRHTIAPTEGNICIFDNTLDMNTLRELVNSTVEICGGVCGVFSGADTSGYRYIMASRTRNLRAAAGEINAVLHGKGGGTAEMIQGSLSASRMEIIAYFQAEGAVY